MEFTHNYQRRPDPTEVELILFWKMCKRQDYDNDDDTPLEVRPLLTLIHAHGSHYFLALLNFETCTVYTFGQKLAGTGTTEQSTWDSWHGDRLWERVALLFGVTESLHGQPVQVYDINWVQVLVLFQFTRTAILIIIVNNTLEWL